MKNTVLIATLLLTFASGYLIASSQAASSPVLLEVAATAAPSCQQHVVAPQSDPVAAIVQTSNQTGALQKSYSDNNLAAQRTKGTNPAELTLNDYSNSIAAQLPAATRLLIRIDDNEFQQLLANHQQQQAGDLAALEYQRELSDYLAEQNNLTVLELDCRADLCLLELDIHDEAAWPQLFSALSSQSWWQSVSYQSSAEVGGARRLLLQQNTGQDWNHTVMLHDDGSVQ